MGILYFRTEVLQTNAKNAWPGVMNAKMKKHALNVMRVKYIK